MFPGRFSRNGNLRYIAVPSSVVDRMGLVDGDYVDVMITWPETEEYDETVPRLNANTASEGQDKKGRRRAADSEDE